MNSRKLYLYAHLNWCKYIYNRSCVFTHNTQQSLLILDHDDGFFINCRLQVLEKEPLIISPTKMSERLHST